ncbi:MAG: PH domain-containing protein [Myxococcota bacterium]
MTFRMTLDRIHRISTMAVLALILAISVGVPCAMFLAKGVPAVAAWMTTGIMALTLMTLAVAWAMAPVALQLKGDELRVLRRWWSPTVFRLADIVDASVGPSLRGRCLRVAGTGGFFGSYGLFWARSVGMFRLFATRCDPTVLISRRSGLPLMATPDEPERFVQALQSWKAAARMV